MLGNNNQKGHAMPIDIPPETGKVLAGPLGAASALLWINDTWPRKVGMVCAGSALSYYATPWIAGWAGLQAGFAGYLLGLFGMAAVSKLFATWDALDLGDLLRRFIAKALNLEDKP